MGLKIREYADIRVPFRGQKLASGNQVRLLFAGVLHRK
jgi:hypothetical protein